MNCSGATLQVAVLLARKLQTCVTSRAGIALGSNLGDRLATLKVARDQITALTNVRPPVLSSTIYETEPVNCEPNAPQFLNAVVEIGWAGEPLELLHELRRIESACGRPMTHTRNTSRTLDLDLLYCGERQTTEAELELPHPRLHERRFVLAPLAEIRPGLVLPSHCKGVASLLAELGATAPLVRAASQW